MSLEVLLLGLISGLRPATSQVAVFALLRAPRAPRTLLAFTVVGLIVTVAVGLVIIGLFDGAGGLLGRSGFPAAFDLIAGVAALGFAAGVQRGGVHRAPRAKSDGAIATRLHRPTMPTAALAGIVTHVPGLIYLAALNAIAASRPGAADAILQVAVYDVLWFGIPIGALVVALRSPEMATHYLDRLTAWARRHQDRLLVVLFGALGTYLTIKGVVRL